MALTLGIGAINTFQEYFVRRGPEPRLYYQLNQDVADLTRYLDSLPDEGQPMYVGALDYRHPTAGGSPGSFRWNRVWYNNLGRTDVAV